MVWAWRPSVSGAFRDGVPGAGVMEFGPVSLGEAEGAILAHSLKGPGWVLKKGALLQGADIARLRTAGIDRVVVAWLCPGDVHEDAAAAQLAQAIGVGSGLLIDGAATGRANLRAPHPGVVAVSAAQIHAINALDPMLTIATVAPWQRLEPRGLAATVKVISYAIPAGILDEACAIAAGAMRFHPVQAKRAVLIQTEVGAGDGARGHHALAHRMERLGVDLAPKVVVPHQEQALAKALNATTGADVIFVLTGSATSDPQDVAPQAVRLAGGRVERYGMPVDPGNLLFLGDLSGVPVIGLPGCARSIALNGADWVLERVLCGVPVTSADIAAMGVGGLLKEIPSRPQPRSG